jgi:hypothetical protein
LDRIKRAHTSASSFILWCARHCSALLPPSAAAARCRLWTAAACDAVGSPHRLLHARAHECLVQGELPTPPNCARHTLLTTAIVPLSPKRARTHSSAETLSINTSKCPSHPISRYHYCRHELAGDRPLPPLPHSNRAAKWECASTMILSPNTSSPENTCNHRIFTFTRWP